MVVIRKREKMGSSNLGWLKSRFHFSFAEYYNPENMNFGKLRVVNDDVIEAGTGFNKHPHRNMEIVTYIVDGILTHRDSLGHKRELSRGMIQYMSAGTGVVHSEHNLGLERLRLLQIWIEPDKDNYKPKYGDFKFNWEQRLGQWLLLASNSDSKDRVKINQDVNISVSYITKGDNIPLEVAKGRQVYLIQIEGESKLSNNSREYVLNEGDAVELTEESIRLQANRDSHFLSIDLANY